MVPVNLAAVAATLVMLHLFFRKDIPRRYALTRLPIPKKRFAIVRLSEPAGRYWRCC